jgi:transglutaminase-like putative cysteine protease
MSISAREALDHNAIPWLFIASLAAIAPHFTYQPLWLSLFSVLILAWAGWLWWKNLALPRRWLVVFIVMAGTAGVLLEYRSLFGRDAGVAMLVLFMAMKQLELKGKRDGLVIVTLGYFLLLTHYFYSQSIPTGIWLLIAMWILTASLIRLQGGPASATRSTLRYAATLTVQAIPFMLVLYLLFPRISGPLWGLPQDAHAGKTGLSDTMEPGSISQLVRNSDIAFRVRFDGETPAKEKLYWRGPVMEILDGNSWRPYAGRRTVEQLETISRPISYETTLEAHNQRWLLALDAPTSLPPETALNGVLAVNHKDPIVNRQRFRLSSSLDYRFNPQEDTEVLTRNLTLPKGINPQTRRLAKQWRESDSRPEVIIRNALEMFAKDFYYTLRPPLLGRHSVDEFLFNTKRGFCEHYSAAFVVLMRSAGIPARVIGGYQGGEHNPVDGYLVVRQSDAHAWAEVWLAERGWVRIDPTAAVSPSRIEIGIADALDAGEPLPALIQSRIEWLRTARYRWEAINNAWNQQILGYNPQRQRELLSRLGLNDNDWRSLALTLAAICALLLSILTAWTLYQRPRLDPATRLWHKALRHLKRRQVNSQPWETPLALLQRVKTEQPALAPHFERVVEAYLLTRYSANQNELKKLHDAIVQLP